MKRVAIIPARGGSKRLPRKNIRPFFGKPVLHYPIAAALESRIFDAVYVSTEDPEISDIAMAAGADLLPRPSELASDTATTAAVMAHAVQFLKEGGVKLEQACCIYPCTPMIEAADFHRGFDLLRSNDRASYVFTVTDYEQHPYRMLRFVGADWVRSIWPKYDDLRNQDLEPMVHDAGQWYWGWAQAWLDQMPIYGAWSMGFRLPRWRAIDIDTIDDWKVAEAAFSAFRKGAA